MGIYDQRDKPAYGLFKVEPGCSENRHIQGWWTPGHDSVLAEQIARKQWIWYWSVTDELVKITPQDRLEAWKAEDPLCARYAWYNILMYFAASRAERLGLTKAIRRAEWKTCLLCGESFVEDSLPGPLIERLGIDALDFCAPCLRDTVLQGSGDNSVPKQGILDYLRSLADTIGRVPTQNFGEGVTDLMGIDTADRVRLLILLRKKPTIGCVKTAFGSWLGALIQAGILEDGTRRTSRGIQTIAKDGHVCLSLGEKTIDDLLYLRGVPHEREPRYPESNFKADFKIGSVFVEYFGLVGAPEYDAKIKKKMRIGKVHALTIVAIYPRDLVSSEKLDGKLSLFWSHRKTCQETP